MVGPTFESRCSGGKLGGSSGRLENVQESNETEHLKTIRKELSTKQSEALGCKWLCSARISEAGC